MVAAALVSRGVGGAWSVGAWWSVWWRDVGDGVGKRWRLVAAAAARLHLTRSIS